MTILEIELLDHLDFDFIPPCEVKGCDPEPAKYRVVFSCCGHTMLWCEPCYDHSQRYLQSGGEYYCEICGAANITKPFAMVDKI